MEYVSKVVDCINTFLWDYALLFLLVGAGIIFTVSLRFVQIRKFKAGMKALFGNFSLHGENGGNGLSSFQALTTAIAAQVGTGNIAGAATAIASGGAGAIFWMWVSAFFGMATIYGEAVMAQHTRQQKDGAIVGNMVQSNSIGVSFANAFHVNPLIVGICVAVVAGIIFLGGIKRIARVTEKVVPLMALLYIVGCVVILCMFPHGVAEALKSIFVGAFAPQAVAGGVLGVTVQKAMRFGVARGLFSNEAGMGSTPHAHAAADVKHPCDQGIIAMMGVFIDTFVILTLTALVILSTGVVGNGLTGSELAQSAFDAGFGSFGKIFIAICMLFFAFTTIVGWYYFGEVNVRFLLGEKAVKIYSVLVLGFVVLGSVLKVDLVWNMSDMFNGLMVLPNLIGLLACLGVVRKLTREYEKK